MKKIRQSFTKFALWGILFVAVLSFLIPTCHHAPQQLPQLCFEQEESLFQRLEEIGDTIFPMLDSLFERMREFSSR